MSFKQSETLNKKNVTISQITYQKQDERYIEAYYTFRDLVNDNFLFEKLIDIKKYKKERRAVSYVLNYYEFISLCVRSKSFDEKIFKELQG
ncbi:MAG: DUF4760 domain-containing protein [Hydrotalea sp.]|nr:DUF4760 domain-containing protein [Hydrotalea sp.]